MNKSKTYYILSTLDLKLFLEDIKHIGYGTDNKQVISTTLTTNIFKTEMLSKKQIKSRLKVIENSIVLCSILNGQEIEIKQLIVAPVTMTITI